MIGVCIKYFHENYGGMLQAFATVKMLESRGIDYELIRYKKKLTITEKIRSVPRLLNGVLLNDKYEAFLKRQGMKKHPEFAKNDGLIVAMNGDSVAEGLIQLSEKQQLRERLVENLKKEKTGNEEEINKYIQLIEENLN